MVPSVTLGNSPSSFRSNAGQANVHCDPLQFLVEFGLAGAGLLALALGALLLIPLKVQYTRRAER